MTLSLLSFGNSTTYDKNNEVPSSEKPLQPNSNHEPQLYQILSLHALARFEFREIPQSNASNRVQRYPIRQLESSSDLPSRVDSEDFEGSPPHGQAKKSEENSSGLEGRVTNALRSCHTCAKTHYYHIHLLTRFEP
ncbi:hypothetical protein M422DRAFT_63704 [Sphaerobolus stellatus SS14]|nr:hypothetical protein M422DRAFT_63704 [Sphaerobolus stellatus SS14]